MMIRRSRGRRVLRVITALLGGVLAGGAQAAGDVDDLLDIGAPVGGGIKWGGYGELGMAWTYADPEHWSKLRGRVELGGSGALSPSVKWKLSARADGDAAPDIGNFYPDPVRRDQRSDSRIRDAYLDISAGDWDFRLGRQHVVWGEMVGLFFADVVSARDLREFLLPEFDAMRIPQWTARAEYFKDDFHAEFIWIPVPSYDDVGKPGSDFFPVQVTGLRFKSDQKPDQNLANTNWGVRLSTLKNGWDLTGFYYRSMDRSPTYYPQPDGIFEPRHDRIHQIGGTVSKDYGDFVLKGEFVHTRGRRFNLVNPTLPIFGMQRSDTLDYVVGLDLPSGDWRFNWQLFARTMFDHKEAMGIERHEPGGSFLVNRKFGDALEAEVLMVAGFNRTDYMVRPKMVWRFAPSWRSQAGLDIFGGKAQGLFGRYEDRDRVYLEVRRDF